jgi:hypothetical protein
MQIRPISRLAITLLASAWMNISCAPAAPPADEEESKIDNAMSAAPASIAAEATITDLDGTVLREGSNGWTCFPNDPAVPANDPSCLDGQWMEFLDAWSNQREPVYTGIGVGYMLQGGGAASLTDPLLKEPAVGDDWKTGPPHLMLVTPNSESLEGMPTEPGPGPWVMWKGTPYVHVMIPLPN